MNIHEIKKRFQHLISPREGLLGVAAYETVLNSLMPAQQRNLMAAGTGESVMVIGVFHTPSVIEKINTRSHGKLDRDAWNVYAREYHTLNALLNKTVLSLAEFVKGDPIPATRENTAQKIDRVEDFYDLCISHRVGAELAGLGWRGKNELIVTREQGCAVRFASVICPDELPPGQRMENQCGDCTACLKVCPYLRKKDVLKNYREQCRRFIVALDLEGDVCGKCVKACYEHWAHQ
jgi:epoxyqueuosine reductase QueG